MPSAHAATDDEPRAQLVEVLDDREPILVDDRPDTASHADRPRLVRSVCSADVAGSGFCSASSARWQLDSSSLSLPVTESLNSRMPLPSERPRSGSRLGPKISSTITRTMMISSGSYSERHVAMGATVIRCLVSGFEVEVEAARRGLGLALVLAARLVRAVGPLDRPVHPHERDLPDRHAVVDRDREVGHVRELERQVAAEASCPRSRPSSGSAGRAGPGELLPSSRATRSSGSVTRSSVWPSTNSPGWRMNGSSSCDLDQLGQVLHRLAHVDVRVARVVEDAEPVVDPHVDARRLDQRRRRRGR